jgi:hypothetical protein
VRALFLGAVIGCAGRTSPSPATDVAPTPAIVVDTDGSVRTVRPLQVVRLDGTRPRHTEPLDTARIASAAQLARDVTRAFTPA